MIRFEHTEVFNFHGALRGMRNSWESWDKSDSWWDEHIFVIGPDDLSLAMKLSKAGSDHGKYLRQIFVCVDIIAPEYVWKELDTYKIGTTANSTSMMHKLGSRELVTDDFSFDSVGTAEREFLERINRLRMDWISTGKKKPSPAWRRMQQNMSIAFLYRRTYTTNYQALKGIYNGRRGHRLEEWETMRKWIRELPYSQLITLEVGE